MIFFPVREKSSRVPSSFFSGVNTPALVHVLKRSQAAGMLNAFSAGEPRLREAYMRAPEVEWVLDSGAV